MGIVNDKLLEMAKKTKYARKLSESKNDADIIYVSAEEQPRLIKITAKDAMAGKEQAANLQKYLVEELNKLKQTEYSLDLAKESLQAQKQYINENWPVEKLQLYSRSHESMPADYMMAGQVQEDLNQIYEEKVQSHEKQLEKVNQLEEVKQELDQVIAETEQVPITEEIVVEPVVEEDVSEFVIEQQEQVLDNTLTYDTIDFDNVRQDILNTIESEKKKAQDELDWHIAEQKKNQLIFAEIEEVIKEKETLYIIAEEKRAEYEPTYNSKVRIFEKLTNDCDKAKKLLQDHAATGNRFIANSLANAVEEINESLVTKEEEANIATAEYNARTQAAEEAKTVVVKTKEECDLKRKAAEEKIIPLQKAVDEAQEKLENDAALVKKEEDHVVEVMMKMKSKIEAGSQVIKEESVVQDKEPEKPRIYDSEVHESAYTGEPITRESQLYGQEEIQLPEPHVHTR